MSRIKNRSSVPSVPIVWRDTNGHAIQWNPATQPFDEWVARVWQYHDANGRPRPTEDSLDQLACQQLPNWACDGQKQPTQRATVATVKRSGGCRGCGGGLK